MIEVGYITIIESKEEFLEEYNEALRRFQHTALENDFDIETEPLPFALKYRHAFDPHECGTFYRMNLEEAKRCVEEELADRIERAVGLLKRVQKI